ncbi:hypothetical protein BXO88_08100, partial [Oribacterium sp. C9]|uniref:hypothetical protein n=1 Tax=Oribacterium sp. C9 TaxID=1943579 RepID=UPI0009D5E15F
NRLNLLDKRRWITENSLLTCGVQFSRHDYIDKSFRSSDGDIGAFFFYMYIQKIVCQTYNNIYFTVFILPNYNENRVIKVHMMSRISKCQKQMSDQPHRTGENI